MDGPLCLLIFDMEMGLHLLNEESFFYFECIGKSFHEVQKQFWVFRPYLYRSLNSLIMLPSFCVFYDAHLSHKYLRKYNKYCLTIVWEIFESLNPMFTIYQFFVAF